MLHLLEEMRNVCAQAAFAAVTAITNLLISAALLCTGCRLLWRRGPWVTLSTHADRRPDARYRERRGVALRARLRAVIRAVDLVGHQSSRALSTQSNKLARNSKPRRAPEHTLPR